jgi:hypothetical protein
MSMVDAEQGVRPHSTNWDDGKSRMAEVTRESIVDAAKQAARKTGGLLSRADFERLTGISEHHIYKLFPDGGWLELSRLAGLDKHPQYHARIPDDDLLAEYHRVASSVGGVPSWPKFASEANISADVVRRRFGGRRGTLVRYLAWLEEHESTSPLLAVVATQCKQRVSALPGSQVVTSDSSMSAPQWERRDGVEYGAPIDFRGLRHQPINEQGVVYLFGMVSRELGFLVEAVHQSYPDCEAKRCVNRRLDRWQHVRIEFEYRSSSFREHDHDPIACDLIVCWEHDWHDCPLEVVELRQVIKELPDEG